MWDRGQDAMSVERAEGHDDDPLTAAEIEFINWLVTQAKDRYQKEKQTVGGDR